MPRIAGDPGRRRPWVVWAVVAVLAALAIEIPAFCGWLSEPAPNGSLLLGGAVRADRAMGIPNQVLDGPLAVEGSHWLELDRALLLGSGGGFLAIDLGEPAAARALVVQAMRVDSLEVEGSLDGETWEPIWTVPQATLGRGMRTRSETFDPPAKFRHLRVRNPAGEGIAALGGVRAYAEIPDKWPQVGPPQPVPLSGFPWFSLASVTRGKAMLALAGALLLVASWWLERRRPRPARLAAAVRALLAVTAGLAALGWWNFLQISRGDYDQSFYGYWDVNHYYMGAKYAPELGYTKLYECILAADVESGFRDARLATRWTRDLSSNQWVRTEDVVLHPERCTQGFSAARWNDFQVDQAKFRTLIPPRRQLEMVMDHGYNGTPVWGILGGAIGRLGPADDLRIALATALDPILLVLTFALIGATFGFHAVCGALILFGTGYAFGNWFTGGAFLRFDWLAASVAGVCCLKRERWILAGILLALAMLLRIFPGFLIGGVGLHALVTMVRERRLLPAPPMLRFAAAVAVAVLALVSASIASVGDAGIWRGFLDNSIKHKATSATWNLGVGPIANLFDDARREAPARSRSRIREPEAAEASGLEQALLWAAAAATLALLARAARREQPWVCAVLGLCWLPFAVGVTFYYYICAILFATLTTRSPVLAIPYAILVACWGLLGLFFEYVDTDLYGWSSAALVLFCAAALAWLALGPKEAQPPGAAP